MQKQLITMCFVCSLIAAQPAYAQVRDNLWNGALIGGSIGAGTGIALTHAVRDYDRVMLVCAGNWRGRLFSLEDFAVAAAFVQRLRSLHSDAQLGDGSLLGMQLANPEELIAHSEHESITRELGFEADIEFACQLDAAPSVPFVAEFGQGWALLEDRG